MTGGKEASEKKAAIQSDALSPSPPHAPTPAPLPHPLPCHGGTLPQGGEGFGNLRLKSGVGCLGDC